MKFISNIKDIEGKTIVRAGFTGSYQEDEMYLTFTDDTYTFVTVDQGYECGDYDLETSEPETDRGRIAVGISTQEEINKRMEEAAKEKKIMAEVRERATYEALKRKFEGGPVDETIVVMKRRT